MIEIGCGVGFHPISFAKKNPEKQMIAIEQTTAKFSKFYNRYLNHRPLLNLFPYQDNAVHFITHLLNEKSVEKYFILYPNPNPKKAHQNKRWHAMPFMEKLIETLVPGGTIELATNESFYAEECFQWMTEKWKLTCIESKTIPLDFSPRTHFEKKYLERGQKCFNLIFEKPQ